MNRVFPLIKVIDKEAWLEKRDEDLDDNLKLISRNSMGMAFYHPYSKTIFVREDCFTLRIMIHELMHWVFHTLKLPKWLHSYWDDLCLFRWHMAYLMLKNKTGSKQDRIELRETIRELLQL